MLCSLTFDQQKQLPFLELMLGHSNDNHPPKKNGLNCAKVNGACQMTWKPVRGQYPKYIDRYRQLFKRGKNPEWQASMSSQPSETGNSIYACPATHIQRPKQQPVGSPRREQKNTLFCVCVCVCLLSLKDEHSKRKKKKRSCVAIKMKV